MMSVQEKLDRTSPVTAKLSVEIDAEKVRKEMDDYFGAISKVVNIQGFRPGKAPLNVVKDRYGKEASEEISQRLVSGALREVVRKHDLNVILPPNLVAVDQPKEGSSFHFEAELDLKPQIPEIKPEELEVEVEKKEEIDEARLQKELDRIQDQSATYAPLIIERPAQKGDKVTVSYTGSVDGQKIEAASVEDQELHLGGEQVAAEFENAAIGMSPGQTKEFEIEFDPKHSVKEVQGRKVKFQMQLKKIERKDLPDWTDEFVQKVDPSSKSLEDLKAKIKEELEFYAQYEYDRKVRDAVGEALVAKYPMDVNPRQKELTAQSVFKDSVQRLVQMGMPQEEVEKQKEEIMKTAAETADRQIRLSYLVESLGQQKEISISDEDVEKRLQLTSKVTGRNLDEIRAYYAEKDEGESYTRMERLRMDVLDEKSLDYAASKARMKLSEKKQDDATEK